MKNELKKNKEISLSRLLFQASMSDILLGLPWIPVYAACQILLAFLIRAVLSLITVETPRVSVNSMVPEGFKEYIKFGQILDRKDLIFVVILCLLGFATLKMLAYFFSNYFIERSGHKVAHSLRYNMLNLYLNAAGNSLDKKNPDRVATMLTTDTNLLQELIGRGLISMLRDTLVVIGVLFSVFKLAFESVLIIFVCAIPFIFALKFVVKKINYFNKESIAKQVGMVTRLLQTKNGVLTVFGLRTQKREFQDLYMLVSDYYNFAKESFFVRTFFRPGMELFAILLLGVVLQWRFMLEDKFDTATYLTIFILFAMAFRPLKNLSTLLAQWNELKIVYQRLRMQWNELRVAAATSTMEYKNNNSNTSEFGQTLNELKYSYQEPKLNHALNTFNLTYVSSDGKPIIRGCSVEIKTGLKVALIGESGSGKTTFLRLCAGLLTPTSGDVFIDRNNLLATQFPYIFRGNVAENILYSSASNLNPVKEDALSQLTQDLNLAYSPSGANLFLQKQIGYLGEGLSGGERARVALARTLLASPNLLLLDEPTANLDAESSELFWHSVINWKNSSLNNTLVAVLHVVKDPAFWDYVYVFSEGKIIKHGPSNEIFG